MKIILIAFGCKVNISEKELLSSMALEHGYFLTDTIDNADIAIINSCGVTSHATDNCLTHVRRLRKNYPKLKIVLTGCLASATDVNFDCVDVVIPNSIKGELFEQLKNSHESKRAFFGGASLNSNSKTRCFFKIQDGCNAFCTYCIIPTLRGEPISMPIDLAVLEFQKCVNAGFKEIVIVGIHIGLYGVDLGCTLLDLLKRLVKIEGDFRIRLSSIEVNEITDELIDLIAQNPLKIATHLHIPLQSGSDKILKLMGRKYSVADFTETVSKARQKIEGLAIGSDVIVGFPTELECDFEECIETIRKSKLEFLHVFPYSIRKGTQAADMSGQLTSEVKHERSKILREIGDELNAEALINMKGKNIRVLSEKGDKGHADNYFLFKLPKGSKANEFYYTIA